MRLQKFVTHALLLSSLSLFPTALALADASGIFPPVPFNGVSVEYKISGPLFSKGTTVRVGSYYNKLDFDDVRIVKGAQFTFSGVVHNDSDSSVDLYVLAENYTSPQSENALTVAPHSVVNYSVSGKATYDYSTLYLSAQINDGLSSPANRVELHGTVFTELNKDLPKIRVEAVKYSGGSVTIRGTASDKNGLKSLTYCVAGGSCNSSTAIRAKGTTRWSVTKSLKSFKNGRGAVVIFATDNYNKVASKRVTVSAPSRNRR